MLNKFETHSKYGTGIVFSWASILDPKTRLQAEMTSRLPIILDHLALMPDAHLGSGATVGSVIPTRGGIIPAAVGIDVGCGMRAIQTNLLRAVLSKGDERKILGQIRKTVPSGVGEVHSETSKDWNNFLNQFGLAPTRDPRVDSKSPLQFGTLGAGNHFVELSEDQFGFVWLIVHSGSRGPGNLLAQKHIDAAKTYCKRNGINVEDQDLSYLVDGTKEFDAYIADMLWATEYALWQRKAMMNRMLEALESIAHFKIVNKIDCHHNYFEKYDYCDGNIWLSRKGAINASKGKLGIIPGSMGTDTFIVEGLGNREAFDSAPHGAGRLFARGEARRTLDVEEFKTSMGERVWQDRDAEKLIDESPRAYKPIEVIMEDAKDLIVSKFKLQQFINYKGL